METYNSEKLEAISKMIADNKDHGDQRLVLWEVEKVDDPNYSEGTQWIETNGDPVFDSEEGWEELKEEIITKYNDDDLA